MICDEHMSTEGDEINESGSENIEGDSSDATDLDSKDSESDSFDALRAELEQTKDKNLRLLAEMDNLRKRLSREREDFHKYASEKLLTDLLPVLDSIDKAFSSSETDNNEKSFSEGFHMVQKQFVDILKRHGLETIDALDCSFDPNLHQAIQKVEKEGLSEEKVVEEFVKGYRLNGRLLRASMVCVGTPKT